MTVNFFDSTCQDTSKEVQFGLSDDLDNDNPAFISLNKENWIAIVDNPESKPVIFIAVDNCISILRANGEMERRCDGILTHSNNIDFVELKSVGKQWITDGIEQLKISIQVFKDNHELSAYRKKRAYLANKKHPQFKYSHKEKMSRFHRELNVRLIIHNIIKV